MTGNWLFETKIKPQFQGRQGCPNYHIYKTWKGVATDVGGPSYFQAACAFVLRVLNISLNFIELTEKMIRSMYQIQGKLYFL